MGIKTPWRADAAHLYSQYGQMNATPNSLCVTPDLLVESAPNFFFSF